MNTFPYSIQYMFDYIFCAWMPLLVANRAVTMICSRFKDAKCNNIMQSSKLWIHPYHPAILLI